MASVNIRCIVEAVRIGGFDCRGIEFDDEDVEESEPNKTSETISFNYGEHDFIVGEELTVTIRR